VLWGRELLKLSLENIREEREVGGIGWEIKREVWDQQWARKVTGGGMKRLYAKFRVANVTIKLIGCILKNGRYSELQQLFPQSFTI
jgi:hypothetical protein